MPYIPEKDRIRLSTVPLYDLHNTISSKGELVYVLYVIVFRYINRFKKSFQIISESIDSLHDAERELSRRVLNEYEDSAIGRNGDVS